MAIEIKYSQAVGVFLKHLQENCMTNKWLESFRQTLQGSFKRFIASELTIYPLNLDTIKKRYTKARQYSFAYSVKKFHTFVRSNPHLDEASFGQAVAEFLACSKELCTATRTRIRNDVFKVLSFDIDDLALSQIPVKVIRDCMKGPSRHMLVRGKRFFKFLIHANLLDPRHLPPPTSKIISFIEQEEDSEHGESLELEQACRIYLRYLIREKRLRWEAIRPVYYHTTSFVDFVGKRKRFKLIRRDDILGYLNHLDLKRGYSQRSKIAVLTTLRSFIAHFAAQGLIQAGVAANIRIKKVKKLDKSCLSEEQLSSIFKGAYLKYQPYEDITPTDSRVTLERWLAARDWAILCLLICTGLRTKEIASLKTDSIDFRQRLIRVCGKGDNSYQVRERIIPVPEPIALSAAETYLHLRPKSIFDHFFLNTHLEPLKTSAFAKVVNKMKQELFRQQSLNITEIRRSFVNLYAQKGIDPLILRQIMGHNSLATTMKYYLTVREQHLREVWEKTNPILYFSKREFEQWMI
jgi:site-specific recombinase XerD